MSFENSEIGRRLIGKTGKVFEKYLKKKKQIAINISALYVPDTIKEQNEQGFRYIDNIRLDDLRVVLIFEEY